MKNGFTLVELAIVLMIVGLLLAGILRAREMIDNTQMKRFMTDQQVISAAYNTYVERYSALPGDDRMTLSRFPNCSTIGLCNNGNGNGMIEELSESTLVVLIAANMLRADTIASPKGPNNSMAASVRNGFWNVHTPVSQSLFGQTNLVWLNLIDGQDNGLFTPAELQRLDFKLDDGNGTSGSMLGIHGTRGSCTNPAGYNGSAAASGNYDLSETIRSCRPFFRL